MKKTAMAVILPICAGILVSCGTGNVYESQNSTSIENPVDGTYTFEYTRYTGCARDDMDGSLKKDGAVITEYSSITEVMYFPEKVVRLPDIDGEPVWYVENCVASEDDAPICYIAYRGGRYPDFAKYDPNGDPDGKAVAAKLLNDNITDQQLTEIFDKCGYDMKCIMELYDFSNGK